MADKTSMNDTLTDEQQLVRRLVQGDEQAFCALYAVYKKRLVYYAMTFLKSPEFAEDIFQDVFTALWNSRLCIDYTQSFRSLLYTMVRNRILNLLRDMDHQDRLKAYIAEHALPADNATEDAVYRGDLEALIEKGKTRLTPRQRQVFELSRDEHLTGEEIARRLDLSVKTVNDHLSDSLKTLRTYLEQTFHYTHGTELLLILFLLGS